MEENLSFCGDMWSSDGMWSGRTTLIRRESCAVSPRRMIALGGIASFGAAAPSALPNAPTIAAFLRATSLVHKHPWLGFCPANAVRLRDRALRAMFNLTSCGQAVRQLRCRRL